MNNNILIKKLKLKRNLIYNGNLREAIGKVKGLMGSYSDTNHDLDEGEPIIVSYKQNVTDTDYNYFLAVGRWIIRQPAPIIIPLYNITSLENYNNEDLDTPLDIDSLYYNAISKYFSGDRGDSILNQYFFAKAEGEPGIYKILITEEGIATLVKSDESGMVDVNKVRVIPGSMTSLLRIEYIDPSTGELIKKSAAETQDEFNYFIYNLLTWKEY